ncbi:hypothetical protein [Prosthecobacter sp.]|uniref:hypothetical protein n=1 Tax=Prosthecobacter sp. TaxID=1965333 RepID=UPI003783C722
MPSLAPAAHFSKVFHDFLSSAAAITYGAPALATVQRRHLTSEGAIINPNLLVECEANPESTDELLMLTVKLSLTVQLGTETGQTTAAQSEQWLKAFRALLGQGIDAWNAWDIWISTLSDADKAGWFVQQIMPEKTESDLNKDTNVLTLTAPYTVSSFWNN